MGVIRKRRRAARDLLGQGVPQAEVAKALGLSLRTIQSYRSHDRALRKATFER